MLLYICFGVGSMDGFSTIKEQWFVTATRTVLLVYGNREKNETLVS